MKTTRTIGIVGGLSWESTALYYRLLNEMAEARHGAQHNARSVVVTIQFAQVAALARQGDWAGVAAILVDAARRLERAGADCVLLSANTAHAVAGEVAAAIGVPLLHIADAAGKAMRAAGHRRVGLLGTRTVVEGEFYRRVLQDRHAVEPVIAEAAAVQRIDAIIFDELTHGRFEAASKTYVLDTIAALGLGGADAVALACTELPLLVDQRDTAVPLFDTVRLHVAAALDFADS